MFLPLQLLLSGCNEPATISQPQITTWLENSKNPDLSMVDRKIALDSAYYKLQKSANDSIARRLLFHVAAGYFDINYKTDFLQVSRKVNDWSDQVGDTMSMAKAHSFIGDYYEDKTQVDSAFFHYNQSEKLYQLLNDSENFGRMLLYKAGILYDIGNFTEGEVLGVKALGLLSKTKNTRLIYESHVIIALCLKNLNNYPAALTYFDLALEQIDVLETEGYAQNKILNSRASCYNNIGLINEQIGTNKKAIELYNKALSTNELKLQRPKLYATLLNNLAHAKMNLGAFEGIEKLMFESLHIRDSLQIEPGIVSSKIMIAEYQLVIGDTAKAVATMKEAYSLAKKIESSPEILASLKMLMDNDEANQKLYKETFFQVSDSLQNVERTTRNKFARIAYETDQVVEKNELLSNRNLYILWISTILMITGIVLFIIFRLKGRNKELIYIKEQQEANEKIYQLMLQQQSQNELAKKEERNRIAMELHDGIVNSIFTTRFNLSELDSNNDDKKQQLIAELKKTEEEVRRVSHDLQQNLLFEDKNLPEIISKLVASQQNEYNTVFDLTVDKYIDWSVVSNENKIHVYRIIQEAIQNVNKYSKAKKCFLMLLKTRDKTTIRIWDDGIGFDMNTTRKGIGIKNIAQRVKALNGEFKITSNKGDGTKIEVIF